MKKLILIAFACLLFIILLGTGAYFWWDSQLKPVANLSQPGVALVVSKGDTAAVIINKLSQQGLIRSPLASKIYFRISGIQNQIKPGDYVLSKSWDTPAILRALTSGPKDVWVTLPEGWRREQMAARLHSTVSSVDPQEFISQTLSLEGQLFPDTYLIPAQAAAADVVKILTANFLKKTQIDIHNSYLIELDGKTAALSGQEILILASLVEREARADVDRPLIAGILLRRLRADWPLQVDASLQYAEGTQRCRVTPLNCSYWEPILDTKVASAYNTYIHPGLPPSAIANPGLAVIEAVLHPQTSPYWYYLTGNDGVTHYAGTLPEHNRNIDKYLKS